MKKDFFIVLLICLVVFGSGYLIHVKSSNSLKKDVKEEVIDNKFTDDEANVSEHFTYDNNKQLKETSYSLEQVYESIKSKKGQTEISIEPQLNDIYQNFYDYFDGNNLFYNVFGESYNFDEYMFVHNYSRLKNNKDIFGMYLINYTKCQVFSNLTNDSREEDTLKYCENEPLE